MCLPVCVVRFFVVDRVRFRCGFMCVVGMLSCVDIARYPVLVYAPRSLLVYFVILYGMRCVLMCGSLSLLLF